ncbi:hypothetical protein LCGC14_2445450 [marine sediment metagenome]|uniref:Uncharacterized protein n=1 Tax=marine sediment metagenome TaxID=412755 RepID=A0A0F9BHU6_9ZZZZ
MGFDLRLNAVIDFMKKQVGVRVDKGDGYSTSPIFNNSALFSGKPLPGFFNLIPAHNAAPFPSIRLQAVNYAKICYRYQ